MHTTRPSFVLAHSIAALIVISGTSFGVNNLWTGTTSTDWNDPTNWSEGRVPVQPSPAGDGFDDALINTDTGNIATITANTPTMRDLLVGARATGATGLLNHRAGTVRANGWAFAGVDGNSGTYNLAETTTTGGTLTGFGLGSGTLNVGGRLYVGGAQSTLGGTGTFNMNTTGTLAIGNDLALGTGGGTGLMNVDAGTITTGGWNFIGKGEDGSGTGTLRMSGGSLTNGGGRTYVGFNAATGHIELSGTGVYNNPGDWFAVGHNNLSVGTTSTITISGAGKLTSGLFVSGGSPDNPGVGLTSLDGPSTVLQTGELWVGNRVGSRGILTINAGNASSGNWIAVGRDGGMGVINITGGGTLTKTGGSGNHVIIGSIAGTGTVNVVGGTLQTVGGGNILLGENGGGSGTLNVISGGVAQADRFLDGPGGGAPNQIYLNNGTIRAGSANVGDFMQGLDNVIIGPSGAILDSNGRSVTIAQSLTPPSGDGLVTIPVLTGGSGYKGQPIVEIIGDGTGASAIANVSGGVVTSITITNPGINYTTATVTLYDGAATTAATVDTPTFGTNVTTGGVTKIGAGTVTLSATNTYTGMTTVNGGTLAVTGDNFSGTGATVNSGGELMFGNGGFGGMIDGNVSVASGGALTFNRNDDLAYTATVTGAGTINKNGPNVLTLGASTSGLNGAMNVNAGALVLDANQNSSVAVNSGGRLVPLGAATGTLTVGGLSLNTNSATDFEFGPGPANDTIVISSAGGLSFGSAFTLNFYDVGAASSFSTNGIYTLFDYTGSFSGSLSNLVVGNPVAGKGYALSNDVGTTSIRLTISTVVLSEWINSGGGLWTVGTNWSAGAPNAQSAEAVFGAAIGAASTVDMNGNKTLGKVSFDNANSYTIAGSGTLTLDNGATASTITVSDVNGAGSHFINVPIAATGNLSITTALGTGIQLSDLSGGNSLTANGSGTVTLNGAGGYSTTTVNGGNLNVGTGGTTGSLGSGAVSLGSGTSLSFNRSDSISVGNAISGAGGVNHVGAGTLTNTGTWTHTGPTNLNSGTFVNSGTINGTSALFAQNTTTLQAASTTTVAGTATITNTGTLTNLGTFNSNGLIVSGGATLNQNGGALTSSVIQINSGGIVNQNAGTVTYNQAYIGNNGSSGVLNLSAGTWTSNQWSVIADQAGSTGAVNMTGGTWNQNHTDWLTVGQFGTGTFTMSGNSVLNDPAAVDTSNRNTGRGNVVVGRWTTGGGSGNGVWTLNDNASARIRRLLVGDQSSTYGEVNFNGASSASASEDFHIGQAGTGIVNMNGGSLTTVSGWTQIGIDGGSTGTLNVNAGSITSREYRVGINGNGFVNVAGGTLNANQSISLGIETGGRGFFNVSSGTVNANVGDFLVSDGGLGVMEISGGTTNITNRLIVGNGASGTGHVNVTGGTVNIATELWVGQRIDAGTPGKGLMEISAGSVTANNWIAVGREGALGVLNVKGSGSLTKTGGGGNHIIIGSLGGNGTANVIGGTLRTSGGGSVVLGEPGGSGLGSGILNVISGGVVQADAISNGPGGGASPNQVYLSGGTLRAATSSFPIGFPFASTFMENLDSAIIGPGGGTIDTNGNNITINQLLNAPSGDGVTTINVFDGGAGYVAQPLVEITGDGFGASAIANVVGGVVTSITITNPGINYTFANVILHGGGATVTANVDPNAILGANVTTGGLTKIGDGTLTITSDGDYGGATTVNDGTLEFTVSQTLSSLVIADGATVVLTAGGPAPGLAEAGAPEITASGVEVGSYAAAVPEPGALGLLAAGVLGVLARRRRTKT